MADYKVSRNLPLDVTSRRHSSSHSFTFIFVIPSLPIMKSTISLGVAVAAFVLGAECRNKKIVFSPALMQHTDRHGLSHIHLASNISLHYASNTTTSGNTNI